MAMTNMFMGATGDGRGQNFAKAIFVCVVFGGVRFTCYVVK